jgi:ABC-type Na+ efflux pump permease subunit
VNARLVLACVLAVLLAASCRIHVTIWLAGHPVARPPVAGLLLAVVALACAAVALAAVRACCGFRSSPYPRTA